VVGGAHPTLLRGVDLTKDQSYVLFGIERRLLSRMLLPVGEYRKPQIRALAAKIGLRVANKKDSQEICFVTSGKHDEFVRQRRRHIDTSGEIVTTEGRVVGTHPGIERFTIGQRKGLRVAMGEPYFVVRIDPNSRQVVIGRQDELARHDLTASRCNWLIDPPGGEFRCTAKIRYNSPPTNATAELLSDGRLRVNFNQPRYGVAPGQAVVLFEGERVLGGGWID
jgi:tRNA-specific 2-thiouridylase